MTVNYVEKRISRYRCAMQLQVTISDKTQSETVNLISLINSFASCFTLSNISKRISNLNPNNEAKLCTIYFIPVTVTYPYFPPRSIFHFHNTEFLLRIWKSLFYISSLVSVSLIILTFIYINSMNKNFSKNHSPFYSLFAYGGERVKLNLKIPPRKLLPPIFYFYFVFLIKFCSRNESTISF